MAGLLLIPEYSDYELLHYNPNNSLIVQRARCKENPQQSVICKGLTNFDQYENEKLKMEFEILNSIHEKLEQYERQKNDLNSLSLDDLCYSVKDVRRGSQELRRFQSLKCGTNIQNPSWRIVKPKGLKMYNDNCYLILEDFGGQPLRQYLSSNIANGCNIGNNATAPHSSINIEEFLLIAHQLSEALDIIHSMEIIHKDINPDNIVIKKIINEYGKLKTYIQLIDFNLAKVNRHDNEQGEFFQGTLAYMSPEQTGRTEQTLDHRTDFYSMGIMLWEFLIGKTPYDYEADDVAEYIHSHLALELDAPEEVDSTIPHIISELVMKLASKLPEDRYQSASGLRFDIEAMLAHIKNYKEACGLNIDEYLDNSRMLECFTDLDMVLGLKDLSDKLYIPDLIFGRELEYKKLVEAYQRVSMGIQSREVCFVSGPFGLGKSSLVNKLHRHINDNSGCFVSGKYDAYTKGGTYSGILEAMRNAINSFLALSHEEFNEWSEILKNSVSKENLQILAELLPDLTFLTGIQQGNQAALSESDKISVNKREADEDSIEFIKEVLVDNTVSHLLILLTCRTKNSIENNILSDIVNSVHNNPNTPVITQIPLSPITASHVLEMLEKVFFPLASNHGDLNALASLIQAKTLGNPYHIKEFLKHADRMGFVYLNRHQEGWSWDLQAIEQMAMADNVVDFMLLRMKDLPEETLHLLKIAACYGNKFDFRSLSTISEINTHLVSNHLWIAMKEGFLISSSDSKFSKVPIRLSRSSSNLSPPLISSCPKLFSKPSEKHSVIVERILSKSGNQSHSPLDLEFCHERIQKAAYAMLKETENKTIHLKIAQLIQKKFYDSECIDENVFELVEHFNEAEDLLYEPGILVYGAKLNYIGAVRAKKTYANLKAKQLFQQGLKFFKKLDTLNFDFENNCIENDFEGNNFDLNDLKIKLIKGLILTHEIEDEMDEAEVLCKELLAISKSTVNRISATQILIGIHSSQYRYKDMLELALKELTNSGVDISTNKPSLHHALVDEFQKFDNFISNNNLLELQCKPVLDEAQQLIQNLLQSAFDAAEKIGCNELGDLLVLMGCNSILKNGFGKKSALFFASVTRIYFEQPTSQFPDMQKLKLITEFTSKLIQNSVTEDKIKALFNQFNYGQAYVLTQRRQIEGLLRSTFMLSKEIANQKFAMHAASQLLTFQLHQGQPTALLRETSKLMQTTAYKNLSPASNTWSMIVMCLDALCFNSEIATYTSLPVTLKNTLDAINFMYLVIYEHSEAAAMCKSLAANIVAHKPYVRNITISVLSVRVLCMEYTNCEKGNLKSVKSQIDKRLDEDSYKKEILQLINEKISWLKNFTSDLGNEQHCKYLIAIAERDRITGNIWSAVHNYESAIEHAHKNGFIMWEAYATELMAKCFVEQQNRRLSKVCMSTAYSLWKNWGSEGKMKQLISLYSEYLPEQLSSSLRQSGYKGPTGSNFRASINSSASTTANNLDVTTMLKVTQSITNESNLEELLAKVIKYVMVNACARKAVLALNEGGKLFVKAHAVTMEGDEQTKVLKDSIPIEKIGLHGEGSLPLSIILFVYRSREFIVLQDAVSDQMYGKDTYIRQYVPRSILCIPIVHQNAVSGVLYLENDTQLGVFNADRVELIKSLMASTSIAIENAKLTKRNNELIIALKHTQKDVNSLNAGPKYNIDAPIKKTIDVLSAMKSSLSIDDPTIQQIDYVMKMLTSSDLFSSNIDDINDEQGRGIDQDTKTWIENSLLQKYTRKPGVDREESEDSMMFGSDQNEESTPRSPSKLTVFRGASELSPLNYPEILALLELSSTQEFDVFKLQEATHGRPLYFLGCHLLEKYGLIKHFNLSESTVRKFFETIEANYHNIPFHNSSHGSDVLQTVNLLLLSDAKMASYFSKLEILAALIASAVHDVDHPGLNNNFLVQSNQKIAVLYNDVSVLEFHHASKAFQIASNPESNIFTGMAKDQFRDVRKLIISMVVATDMAQHFQYINKLKGKIVTSSLRLEDAVDRTLVLEMAIKCADLNNPSKPTEQCTKWVYNLMKEFFVQGDLERKMGIPVTMFMDRNDMNIPKCQIGFIDILVTPLFDSWSQCIKTDFSRYCMENLVKNRAYWESLLCNPDAVPKFPPEENEYFDMDYLNERFFGSQAFGSITPPQPITSQQQSNKDKILRSPTKSPVARGSMKRTVSNGAQKSPSTASPQYNLNSSNIQPTSTKNRPMIKIASVPPLPGANRLQTLPDLPNKVVQYALSTNSNLNPSQKSNSNS
ncbi:hypothetical protein HK099_008198 [Clydaea vesicula]|uniref:Phosphodiesterase n=1 Tax=Clydaea vesicula TaxID=447962 RepID=A0AAD5U4Z1_9FUNG|nr:hypothetical protein HK099_008198 [Clydaea vesicula]